MHGSAAAFRRAALPGSVDQDWTFARVLLNASTLALFLACRGTRRPQRGAALVLSDPCVPEAVISVGAIVRAGRPVTDRQARGSTTAHFSGRSARQRPVTKSSRTSGGAK